MLTQSFDSSQTFTELSRIQTHWVQIAKKLWRAITQIKQCNAFKLILT